MIERAHARSPVPLLLAALAALQLGACSDPSKTPQPEADAGAPIVDAGQQDAGEPCDDCDAGADAGADAGEQDAGFEVVIDQVVPSRGVVGGGANVTLEGGHFYRGFASGSTDAKKDTHVFFGGNEASDFRIIDDDTLEVTAPPGSAGPANVVVRNPNGTAVCQGCFTYYVELALSELSPVEGPLEGGTEVVLSGQGFGDALVVLFGGRASPRVLVESDARARAVVPPSQAAGPVDVRAFNKNGVAELRRGFRYVPALALGSAEPAYGPLAGGARIRLHGAGLTGAQQIFFGGTEASFTVLDDATLEATLPAAAVPGPVDLTAVAGAATATLPGGFVYYDELAAGPALSGVWPTHGPARGGNRVLLVGSGLEEGSRVYFGALESPAVTALGSYALEAEVPAGVASSWVDLRAAGAGNEASLPDAYHYNLRLGSVAPASGVAAGGESVRIEGEGLVEGLEVFFGPLPATEAQRLDATALLATTPPGAGPVDVIVREAADPLNEDRLAAGFEYLAPLGIGRLTPESGAIAGGTLVTALGSGFEPGLIIEIGGSPMRDLQLIDEHTVVGRTPPGEVGLADVVVRKGTASDLTPGGFAYFNPARADGGSSGGPINGTLNVTVLGGTDPLPGANVMLGDDPETLLQGRTDSRGQISFSDPTLVKAQQVTVSKDGYLTLTIARQESRDLTVFLYRTSGSSGGAGVDPGFTAGSGPAIISGRVSGFKLPRPLEAGEEAVAQVWVAPTNVYSTPPIGYMSSPDTRDAQGERWQVFRDGGTYSVFSSKGLRAVYALFGIRVKRTGAFTPVLLGIRRGISADPDRPATDEDILLEMHLDARVPITVSSPPWVETLHRPAYNESYAWLELGGEGVIPLGNAAGAEASLVIEGLPRVDGGNLLFLNRSSTGGVSPDSYCFRRQLGDVSAGVTIGPMLGLPHVTVPAWGERFEGELGWSLGDGPDPDLFEISVTLLSTNSYGTVWQAIVPGAERSVRMPRVLLEALRADAGPADRLYVSITATRSPRFEYQNWSYAHLYLLSQTAWASGSGELEL